MVVMGDSLIESSVVDDDDDDELSGSGVGVVSWTGMVLSQSLKNEVAGDRGSSAVKYSLMLKLVVKSVMLLV